MKKILVLSLILAFLPFIASAENVLDSPLSSNIRALLFADAQFPAHSTQNPDNAFLQIYRYSGEIDLRPDFYWEQPFVSAVFKPRFTAAYQWGEDGALDGKTDSQSKAFVNEWRVQVQPQPILFFSFGKEKLLWGPSFLASPSNILFKDTEKLNPKNEVEGKYLAKALLVPDKALTLTVLSETQKDETGLREKLKPLRAVKGDTLGSNYQVSLVGYHRQDDRYRFGSYGQWTASDALLLYYDGIVAKGTDALYPVPDATNPLGASFVRKYEDSSKIFTTVTTGGAYTFLSGSTLSIEFLYNDQGYNDEEAAVYYALRQRAHDAFFSPPFSGLATLTLAQALNTDLPFLRRYYLMGQYQIREIKNVADVIFRYVYSLEERAGLASTIFEWQMTNWIQFFNINSVAVNGGQNEFNSLLSKSFMAGIEVHF